MTANRRRESEADEQYSTQRGPIEEELDDVDSGGSETARNVAAGAGVSASLIVAIGFILFVIVLLGYIIANAL